MRWGAVFILIFVSLFLTCKCDNVENSNESVRDKDVDPSASQAASPGETRHGEESSTEEVQAEKQQWHTTEFGINDALEADKADSKTLNDSPGDSKSFTPPPAKDHFQEELVIRPLHSGDIYASFQFGIQLDTDFEQEEKKGCLYTRLCAVKLFCLQLPLEKQFCFFLPQLLSLTIIFLL